MISALLTLIGWLASTFSLIGKMTFWSAAWSAILAWSEQFPHWLFDVLEWIGAQAHWLAEAFREFVYPVIRWTFQWLPFELTPVLMDVISIVLFGVFGAYRIFFVHRRLKHERRRSGKTEETSWQDPGISFQPWLFSLKGGLLLPLMIVQVFPLSLAWNIVFGLRLNTKEGAGMAVMLLAFLVLSVLALVAFPLSIFVAEWAYLALRGA